MTSTREDLNKMYLEEEGEWKEILHFKRDAQGFKDLLLIHF